MTARAVTLCLINFDGMHYLSQALDAAEPHTQFAEDSGGGQRLD